MTESQSNSVQGSSLHICSFESRRATEMQSLIERRGGKATVAPSLREVPLEEHAEAFEFAEQLLAGEIDLVIFMTGVGAETLMDALETRYPREEILRSLGETEILVRGPKPTTVLKRWGTRMDYRAPEPNTWREIVQTLDEIDVDFLNGKTIAVQEYGRPNEEFYDALKQRGAIVLPVQIYRWALPENLEPLQNAIRQIVAGEFDVLLFTSAKQVEHLLEVAEQLSLKSEVQAAAANCRIASIGPTCTESLEAHGFKVSCEASPPKMGQLVKIALESVD